MHKLAAVFALLFVILGPPAFAATITVTTTSDDLTPNDGSVSLREAITAINAGATGDPDILAQSPGTFGTNDKILFNIPGAGLHTIAPATNLPTITQAVLIDGYSQGGASANTLAIGDNAILLIELTGSGVSGGTGLNFSNAVTGGEVRGLLMTLWSFNAILLNGASNMVIDGNFLGTNAAGSAFSPFTTTNNFGLFVAGAAVGNTIGGATAAARNLISGNIGGIAIGNVGTTNNLIQNNYIGTNAAGTFALPNYQGISFDSADANTVRGNVISGNSANPVSSAAIEIDNLSNHILVVGNKIGTNAAGTAAIPNLYGIIITDGFSGGSTSNTIGTAAEPNIIAFNTKAGVALTALASGTSRLNSIRYNSIFSNGALGIDLGNDGITPNDPGDGDTGLFNDLQNYPVLTSAQFSGGTITIAGTLNSLPSGSYNVQFFQSPACDPSGAGEGKTFLGEATVNTDVSGNGTFNASFPGSSTGVITATATDSLGNTSEFSLCSVLAAPGAIPTMSNWMLLLLVTLLAGLAFVRLR
ncbi:MAG TPA: CSLREA domain-containing protein [Thermoanaerobaculia bacterium]|nr:CSLREA domain-containing protein [Thermoanaerobaculia bacterium]